MPTLRPSWSRIGGALVSVLLATAPLSPTVALAATSPDKAETVHVQTDPSGAVTSITVSELLANDAQAKELEDQTSLTGIAPTEDTIGYRTKDDGTLVWTALGSQVSYEGSTTAEPPVSIRVTYTLDGRTVKPQDLAGASGHLIIRLDYQNNHVQTSTIGGVARQIHTPFVCMTAALLDSDVFSNVQATNAKVIDDKGGLAVVGYAVPGLRESLGSSVDALDLDLPDYLQIEGDVRDLQLDPLYTIVTPELFADLDTGSLELDGLDGGTDELRGAMSQLISGSSALTGALGQLADGSEQLGGGAAALKEALGALPQGVAALTDAATKLTDGLSSAHTVATQLADSTNSLQGLAGAALGEQGIGAAQAAVGSAQERVSHAATSLGSLKEALDAYDIKAAREAATTAAEAAGALGTAARAARDQLAEAPITVNVPEGVGAGIDGAILALETMDTSTLDETQAAAVAEALAQAQQAKSQLAGIAATQEPVDFTALDEAAAQLAESTPALQELSDNVDDIQAGYEEARNALAGASEALGATAPGFATATSSVSQLSAATTGVGAGIAGLAQGLNDAQGGAQGIAGGLSVLGAAAPQALAGAEALATGSAQLTTGITAAAEGSGQLTSGLSAFDSQGIAKLVDALRQMDDDLGEAGERLDALRDAAAAYDNFAGKTPGQSGSVRFIYKTEQIG